jgi:hypothetical protein
MKTYIESACGRKESLDVVVGLQQQQVSTQHNFGAFELAHLVPMEPSDFGQEREDFSRCRSTQQRGLFAQCYVQVFSKKHKFSLSNRSSSHLDGAEDSQTDLEENLPAKLKEQIQERNDVAVREQSALGKQRQYPAVGTGNTVSSEQRSAPCRVSRAHQDA